jgi:hypothetical protein
VELTSSWGNAGKLAFSQLALCLSASVGQTLEMDMVPFQFIDQIDQAFHAPHHEAWLTNEAGK